MLKEDVFALGMLFLTFGSSFFIAHQTVVFLLMPVVIGHENKKEELVVLANRTTDLRGKEKCMVLETVEIKIKAKKEMYV